MAPGPHDGYRRIRPGFSRRARTQSTPLNDGPTNSCVAYAKGAWVLAMLERVVGRTALEHGMRGVRCGSAGQNGVQDFLPGFGAATATAERFLKPWVEKPGCSGNSCRPAIGKAASVTTGNRCTSSRGSRYCWRWRTARCSGRPSISPGPRRISLWTRLWRECISIPCSPFFSPTPQWSNWLRPGEAQRKLSFPQERPGACR